LSQGSRLNRFVSNQNLAEKINVRDPNPNPNPNPKGSERFEGSESKLNHSDSDPDPKGSEGKFYIVKHILKRKIHLRDNKYLPRNC